MAQRQEVALYDHDPRDSYKPAQEARLSEGELVALSAELDRFRHEVDTKKGKVNVLDVDAWMESRGAITRQWGIRSVVVYDFKPWVYNEKNQLVKRCDCKPILYEQLRADLEQYQKWNRKATFVEQKRLEDVEALQSIVDPF